MAWACNVAGRPAIASPWTSGPTTTRTLGSTPTRSGKILKSERDNGLAGPAMETNREGMELSRKLAIANPEISSFAISRMEFAYDLGDGLATAGRSREAIAAYREAIEAAGASVVRDNPAARAWAAAAAARSAELLGEEGAIDAVDSKAERDRLIAFAMTEMARAVDAGAIT